MALSLQSSTISTTSTTTINIADPVFVPYNAATAVDEVEDEEGNDEEEEEDDSGEVVVELNSINMNHIRTTNERLRDDDNDSFGLVYFIFLLLGIGVLVPWNAFISSVQYFQVRTCKINFESLVGILFNLSSVLSLAVLMIAQNGRSHSISSSNSGNRNSSRDQQHSASYFWLVKVPLVAFVVVFVLTDILVLIPSTILDDNLFLVITLIGIVVCGSAVAFSTTGIVAFASLVSPAVGISPFLAGQAVGGVLVSVANFISQAGEDPTIYWNQHCTSPSNYNNTNNNSTRMSSLLKEHTTEDTSYWAPSLNYKNSEISENNGNNCLPYVSPDWNVFIYFLAGSLVLLTCVVGFRKLQHMDGNSNDAASSRNGNNSIHYQSILPIQANDAAGAGANADSDADADANININAAQIMDSEIELEVEFEGRPKQLLKQNQIVVEQQDGGPETTFHHQQYQQKDQRRYDQRLIRANSIISNYGNTGTILEMRQSSFHEPYRDVDNAHSRVQDYNGNDGLVVLVDDNSGIVPPFFLSPSSSQQLQDHNEQHSITSIFYEVKSPAFTICFTFLVTLSLFPSWTSQLRSIHQCQPYTLSGTTNTIIMMRVIKRLQNDLFTPMTFVLFNM